MLSLKVLKVTFKSAKSIEELSKMSEASLPKFRALKERGLIQKLYVSNPETEERGGIYIFESQEAVEEYLNGPIYTSIAERFETGDTLRYEIVDCNFTLYPIEK